MYCGQCGYAISTDAKFCPNCGQPLPTHPSGYAPLYYGAPPYWQPVSYAPADTLLKVACFFFPVIGIIIYFLDRDKKPVSAKQCLNMSLAAIGISVGVVLFAWLAIFLLWLLLIAIGI